MAGAGRRHLEETGMAYGAHLGRAWKIGGALVVAGGACFIHGLFPSLFSDNPSCDESHTDPFAFSNTHHASRHPLCLLDIPLTPHVHFSLRL